MTSSLLLCAFGSPSGNLKAPGWEGPNHCGGCNQEAERLSAEFRAEVQAGTYDGFGYTKAEAKHRKPVQLEFRMEG